MDIAIVIPAFNEEKNIAKVINDLKKNGYNDIIVVDDGSTDNTHSKALENGAIVLKHIINRGQGAALRTGIEYALKRGAKAIVTFDADGQHKAKDIKKLVVPIKKGIADVALGSRFIGKAKEKIPFSRKILLKIATLMIWFFYGTKMSDAHNGLRCFSPKAAEKIKITQDGMSHASEIIEEIVRNRLNYIEVPVEIRYTKTSLAKGHGSLAQAIKILWDMFWKKFFSS